MQTVGNFPARSSAEQSELRKVISKVTKVTSSVRKTLEIAPPQTRKQKLTVLLPKLYHSFMAARFLCLVHVLYVL